MKVLHVIDTLGRGGAEQALVNLLPELQKAGITCEVAVLNSPYDLGVNLEEKGITVHRFNLSHRWAVVEGTRKLLFLLQKKHYDFLHAHLFFSTFYTAMTRLLWANVRRIVTFHNETFIGFPADSLWRIIRKWLETKYTRHWIDAKIAVSHAVASHYSKHLKLSEIDVIHNALPVEFLNKDFSADTRTIRKKYGVNENDFLVISPARLIPQKGHIQLIMAIDMLRAKGRRVKTLIFGDGPLHLELCRFVEEKELSDWVMVNNAISHENLMLILQASDLFAMPSLFEGFGIAPAEAMAMGIPVVASRVGGLVDLLEDGVSGILVEPGQPDKLADAIDLLIGNKKLSCKIGEAGRQRVRKKFTSKVIAKRYVEFYITQLKKINSKKAV